MLYGILIVVQVLVSVGIIALVLMQHGKGADAGAAFGSGASATVFGARGSANFLSRATAILAAAFFANGLLLAHLAANQPLPQSLIERMEAWALEQERRNPTREIPEELPGTGSTQDVIGDIPD
ncbi:MAG: preprotein translocase subunit SecG [Thioalkalivibrionaceae bacterium]